MDMCLHMKYFGTCFAFVDLARDSLRYSCTDVSRWAHTETDDDDDDDRRDKRVCFSILIIKTLDSKSDLLQ